MSQTEWDWETGESFSLEDILNEYRSESSRESAETYQIPAAKTAPHRSSLPHRRVSRTMTCPSKLFERFRL